MPRYVSLYAEMFVLFPSFLTIKWLILMTTICEIFMKKVCVFCVPLRPEFFLFKSLVIAMVWSLPYHPY